MDNEIRIEVTKKVVRIFVDDSLEAKYTIYPHLHETRDEAIVGALECIKKEIRQILTEGR